MNDTGPVFLVDRRVPGSEPGALNLPVEYDDADHFVRSLRELVTSRRVLVTSTQGQSSPEQFAVGRRVVLVFSFPGLLRPVCIDGSILPPGESPSPPQSPSLSDAPEANRTIAVEPVDLDGHAENRLNDLIAKIESQDPDHVARAIRVLVVEDNPHCAKLIQEGLHLAGKRAFGNRVVFDVPMASNAADAFTFLHSRTIDVLITDIYLGGVSGTTVIEHVRRDSGLRSIPVIAISAGDEATKQVAMEAGADVFLPKPVRLRQIVGTVGRVLNLEQIAWR